jgi:hypothetical protein
MTQDGMHIEDAENTVRNGEMERTESESKTHFERRDSEIMEMRTQKL